NWIVGINRTLLRDALEVVDFAYGTGRDVSGPEIEKFVTEEWCKGQPGDSPATAAQSAPSSCPDPLPAPPVCADTAVRPGYFAMPAPSAAAAKRSISACSWSRPCSSR